jgi:hypothetical protein
MLAVNNSAIEEENLLSAPIAFHTTITLPTKNPITNPANKEVRAR